MFLSSTLESLAEARRAGDPGLTRFFSTLERRVAPFGAGARLPSPPPVKALLSRDGGVCPRDGSPLRFDPASPERHRCPRCGSEYQGDRHYRHWARAQHLWLAERAGDLALLAATGSGAERATGAEEAIAGYGELYLELPNRDNVLGPSHLFFSTYLESLWINSLLLAAVTLREAGQLSGQPVEAMNRIADEAATLIAEFNEGLSNRQTWHAAALAAIAVWFDDPELMATAVESRSGLAGHLADGFGADGLWWEGENYHLFALRGLMQGIGWARAMGYDLIEDPEVRRHFRAALLAPALTALPDGTFPARGDSRYGVSLAHPAYLELWEMGRLWLGPDDELDAWLSSLYALSEPAIGEQYDAWLHDAGLAHSGPRDRTGLSAWVAPAIPLGPPREIAWAPSGAFMTDSGLAVLRSGSRYASLECGPRVAGHGHPDRLHLSFHDQATAWLPDPGTGSYVEDALAWYRSALAHNVPLVDGLDAGGAEPWCAGFEAGPWSWCRGRAGPLTRTIVLGPDHLLDVLDFRDESPRDLALAWHPAAAIAFETPGEWSPAALDSRFVEPAEARPAGDGAQVVQLDGDRSGATVRAHFLAPGAELVRGRGPGLPGRNQPAEFLLIRARTREARWVAVLDFAPPGSDRAVASVRATREGIEVTTGAGITRCHERETGLVIEHPGGAVRLGGLRPAPRPRRPLFEQRSGPEAEAAAPHIDAPPALDGTLDGFHLDHPLTLEEEHHYRRSEEPWDPERMAATAWANWDGEALYLAVQVRKPDLVLRPDDAPPLDLDNEPEDINSDGIQLYFSHDGQSNGVLIGLDPDGRIRSRPIGSEAGVRVEGAWIREADGYSITCSVTHPVFQRAWPGLRIGFDLLVNEMTPDRVRRAGQLVWSGGNGWVYLRGDRQDPASFGVLELR